MIQHFQQVLLSNHTSLRDSLYFFRAGEAHSPIEKHSEQEWTYFPVSMFNIPHLFGMVRVVSTDATDNMWVAERVYEKTFLIFYTYIVKIVFTILLFFG